MQRLIKSPLPAIAAIAALVLLIPLCISLADAAIDSPVPVASVADGSAYPELAGAWDITTVVINASTYALVTGSYDLGVQIIDITDPASPTHVAAIIDDPTHSNDKKFDTLSSPHGITTVDIGTSTYALVASSNEGGIQIINITDPADPAPVVSIRNDKTYPKLAGAWDVTTVKINSSTYAMVTSNEFTNGGGVQIINITNPADPAPVSSFGNGDTVTVGGEKKTYDTLAGANGITTVKIDSSTYALVTAYYDNGVQIINITNPASPVPAASITDNSTINLAGAVDITTVKIDSSTYALVAASNDNGVQIINITNPADPVPVASITDNSTINLAGAYGITTVTDGSSTYALVAASNDNGVQIIDITNPADPVPVASVTDEQEHDNDKTFDELEGAHGITTVTDGSSTYALVAAFEDHGVQIIDISTATEEESTTDRQPSTQSDTDAITTSKQTSTDATSVPADWGLIPSDLGEGQDRFRLLIVTSAKHNAASTDITVYDTFVRNLVAAGHADIQEYSSSFRVVGSTSAVDARVHTGTTYTSANKGPPIYWLDGAKVADNYQDFYDGSWDEPRSARNENGDEFVFDTGSKRPYTGSTANGVASSGNPLGSNVVVLGSPDNAQPLGSTSFVSSSSTRLFYGISPVFQIGTTNAAPIADAGPNQHVQERDTVTLDGTNSADPDDGDTLTYSWSQTSGSPAVPLENADTASPTFTAPSTANFTALTFALTTNDGSLSSNNDTVTVTVYDDQTIFARSATYYENHGILGITFNKDVNLLISTELDLFHIRESGSDDGGSNLLSSKLLITTGSTAHFKLDSSTDSAVRALASPEADIEPDFTYSQGGFSFDYDQNDLPIKSGAFLPLIESVTLAARDELTVRFLSNVDTDITNGTGWILFGADVTAANLAIESNSDPGGIKDTMTLALNASLPGTATRFDDVHVKYQRPSGDGGGIFNGTEYLGNTADIKAADGLPPVPVSAAAASAMSTSITVTFSENVLGSHGAGSFSLSRAAGSATTTPVPAVVPETIFTDSETLTLNLNSTIGNNDLTVAYNQDLAGSGIADVAGNPVASFEGIPVGTQSAPTPPTPPDGNAPPTASIAAPARAAEGTTVTLVGTGSSDSDGTISLYAWTANNTSITIIDADKAEASFTAPQVTANATLVITLKVTDDDGATGSANHTMTLYDTNRLPAADAGPNQHVQERDTVTLDGTGSADPDGDTLTYSWSQTSGSSTITLTNANTTSPTFTAPQTGGTATLEFTLTASDSSSSNGTDTVTVTVYDDQTVFARSATYYENHGLLDITFNRDIDRTREIVFDSFLIRESGSNSGGSVLTFSELLKDAAAGSTMTFMLNPSTDDAVRALTSPKIDIEADAVFGTDGTIFNYDQTELPVVKSGAFLPLIDSVTLVAHNELAVRFLSNVDTDITDGAGWILFGADAAGLAIKSNSDPGGITDAMTLALNASLPDTATRFDDVHVHYQRPPADGDGATAHRGGIFNGTEYLDNARDIKAADGLPPVPVSAAASSSSATSVTVTFSENVKGSHGAGSFSLSRAAGSAATTAPIPAVVPKTILTDSPTLTLGLDGSVGNNTLVINYNRDLVGSSMADVAGNPVASFADIPVSTPDVNRPPTAIISAPARVTEGDAVTLDGTASADDDGTISSYAWTANDTSITITSPSQATASFTAPQVTEDTSLVITLQVTDDDGDTGSANHTMTIANVNQRVTDPPRFVSAELDESAGVLNITFDKAIDASGVNATKFHIRESGSITGGVTLSGASVTVTTPNTITLRLAEADRQTVIAMNTPYLEIDAGAVSDRSGNLLTESFDLTHDPSFLRSFYVAQDTQPVDIAFSPDGTKMFIMGIDHKTVRQYALSTPFDITNASYNDKFFVVKTQDDTPLSIAFSPDGTKMFMMGGEHDAVRQYALSTPFDITTASYNDEFFVVRHQDDQPVGITFSPDGTKMSMVGRVHDAVRQYALSTPFDITTASYSDEFFVVRHQEKEPTGFAFSPDGTKIFIVGRQHDAVQQYALSTPFDITTASYNNKSFVVKTQDDEPNGIAFSSDGTKMFIIGNQHDRVYEYHMRLLYNINRLPTADAGPNQHVQERDTVTLDGINSADPDGGDDTLTYSWSQTSGSPTVPLTNANTTSPTFTAPSTTTAADPITLEFTLTASDSPSSNGTDTVTVTVYDDQTVFARSATYYENHGLLDITFNRDIDRTREIVFDSFLIRESGSNSGGSVLTSSELLKDAAAGSTMTFRLNPSTDDAVGALTSPKIDIEAFAVFGTNNILFNYDQVELPVVKSGAFLPLIDSVTLITHNEITVRFLSNVDTDITDGAGWILFGADAAGLAIKSNSDPGGTTDAMTLALNASLPGTATRFDDVHVHYQRPPADGDGAAAHRGGIFNGTEYLDNARNIKAADGLPPVPVSAAAASDTATSITVTFSENVKGSHGAGSFSLSLAAGSTATSIPIPAVVPKTILTDSSTLTLGLDGPVGNNTLVIGYNQNLEGSSMADVAGNPVASFANIPVSTPFTGDTGGGTPDANRLPTASISAPARVNEGDTVTLDGTGSTDDPDGTISSYAWTTNDTSITITNPSQATASFTAPSVEKDTSLVITLKVTDNNDGTDSAQHTMTITNVNQLPTASISAPARVNEGDTVTLDGTGSTDDPDGTISSYAWTTNDTSITITNPSQATASFTAPSVEKDTSLVITLKVTDNNDGTDSAQHTMTITNVNQLPTASISAPARVNEGDTVTLDGTGSTDDPDGTISSYAWTTNDTSITITNPSQATASFTAPSVEKDTSLVITLKVTDNNDGTDSAQHTMTITNVNQLPTASISAPARVNEGDTVTLDGTGSTDDPDGTISSYAWTTNDTSITITNPSQATASFTAPSVEKDTSLVITLKVTDNNDGTDSAQHTMTITNVNQLPTASISAPARVNEGDTVTLDGTGSTDDPDGTISSYAWTTNDTSITITNPSQATASFTAPSVEKDTSLVITLKVTDNNDGTDSAQHTMTITNVNQLPTASISAPARVNEGDTVTLDGTGSTDDPDGTISSYAWTTNDTSITITNPSQATASFTAPSVEKDTSLVITLKVTDNNDGTDSAQHTMTITNVNQLPTASISAPARVNEGDTVTLDGTGSTDDPDGTISSYAWTTNDTSITITNPSQATASFTAPSVEKDTSLVITLKVTDNNDGTDSAQHTMTITNVNQLPTASISAPARVNEGDTVTLDGTGSTDDPDGTISSYAWTTNDTSITITDDDQATASFTAPNVTKDTLLVITLVVTDNDGGTGSANHTMTITNVSRPPGDTTSPPPNNPPVISHTVDTDQISTTRITLDRDTGFELADLGVTCSDPDDDDTVRLTHEASPAYDKDTEGRYSIFYTCTDSRGLSTHFQVVLHLSAPDTTRPTISLVGDPEHTVDKGASYDDPGAECADLRDDSPELVTSGFVDTSEPGTYEIEYTCKDAAGNESDTVTRKVTVLPDTTPPTFTVNGNATDFATSLAEGQTYRNGKIENITETGSPPTSTEIRYYSGAGDAAVTTDENKINSINNTMPPIGHYTIQYTVSDSAVSPNTHTITETLTVRAPATVTIGAIVSTTGSISSLGIPANDTIHLAVNDFNDRYLAPNEAAWRLAVSTYDDGSASEDAIAALELLAGSNITSIVGPLTSDALSAVKGHALFDNPPRLAISYASTAPTDDLKQKDDRVFRTVPDDSNTVRAYVSLFEADSVDYVIPVFRNDAWGVALNRTLADEIDDHNNSTDSKITVHGGILYNPDTVSLSANTTLALLNDTLSRDSVSEKAPAVVVFGFSETLDILSEAAATANLPAAKWYGSDAVAPSKLLEGDTTRDEKRKTFLERTDYNVLTLAIDENEKNKRIDSSVDNADVYSYAAYDAVFILGTAIHLNGGPAGNMVNEGLIGNIAQVADNANGHYTDPAMGNTTLNEYGDLLQADYFVLSLDAGSGTSFEPEFRYYGSSGTLEGLVSSGGGGGGSSGDVSAPSIRTGFGAGQYPLVYDGIKYGPDTINSPHTATIRAGSGEKLLSTLTVYENGGAQNVRHVDMFVAHDGRTIHNDGTETHVTYDSGNIRITDPHGLIASATVDASAIDATKAQFEFVITFAKKVPLSDVLYRLWDTSRNALYIHLEDALVVSEGRKGGSSSSGGGGGGGGSSSGGGGGSSSSSTVPPATGSGNGTTTTTTATGNGTAADTADKQQPQQPRQGFTAEQLDTLKQWGGFASQSASDSQLLAQFGIEGTSIPTYFKQTAKWFLDADADDADDGLTAQEFVAALSYLGQRGLLLN